MVGEKSSYHSSLAPCCPGKLEFVLAFNNLYCDTTPDDCVRPYTKSKSRQLSLAAFEIVPSFAPPDSRGRLSPHQHR